MLLNMKDLLAPASKSCFAVPAFNISDYSMFNGIMEASEEKRAPVIIEIHPDDAKRFVDESGVDTLAVSIGTSHGLYSKGMTPKLRLDLLKEIKAKVSIPLVLHGGSNNPDEEMAQAVKLGINKINISSDIKAAYFEKMREVLADPSVREPNVIQPPCVEAMKKAACHKIGLFEAAGKADLY